MADKLREAVRGFRAARADGKLRLPWEKPLPYRRESPGPGVTIKNPPECGSRHKPSIKGRIKEGLQAVDEWLELPDMARKVLIKGGKIVGTGVTAVGVLRIGYFEIKRLREQDGAEPLRDGYEHARASVLSYIQGQPCQDPSTTFVQSVKDLFNPFYIYKKPANEEPAQNPAKKPVEEKNNEKQKVEEDKNARNVEAMVKRHSEMKVWGRLLGLKRNDDKDKDKDKEKPEGKGSDSGQVHQGPVVAPKK